MGYLIRHSWHIHSIHISLKFSNRIDILIYYINNSSPAHCTASQHRLYLSRNQAVPRQMILLETYAFDSLIRISIVNIANCSADEELR